MIVALACVLPAAVLVPLVILGLALCKCAARADEILTHAHDRPAVRLDPPEVICLDPPRQRIPERLSC